MKKRVLSIVLALCLVFSLLPVSALADEAPTSGTCGKNLTWSLDSNGTLTITGTGEMDDYDSEDVGENEYVTTAPWGHNYQSIKSIVLEDGITSVGLMAFCGCNSLTSVSISDSVTSIGYHAFEDCSSLTSITIPDSITSIGVCAFSGCSSLTSIIIPDSVTTIGDVAFYGCSSLTSVTIPNSVTSIGYDAFSGCSSLTSVTIPDSVTSIRNEAFHNCSSLTSVTIGNGVTSIGDYTFNGCSSLKDVYYSGTISEWEAIQIGQFNDPLNNAKLHFVDDGTAIRGECGENLIWALDDDGTLTISGTGAMNNYSLSKNANDEYVTSAPWEKHYESIMSVVIENGVTSVGKFAFRGCSSLTSVTIPDSLTAVGWYAFDNCSSITDVYYTGDLSSWLGISFSASSNPCHNGANLYFNGKLVTDVVISDSVTNIGNFMFEGCSCLTSVTIPNSVTSIGIGAFDGCSGLTSITIPDGVTSIGSSTFNGCSSLTSITIPDGVTSIGNFTFDGCSSLTSITIPDGVTSIGNYAFYGCSSLRDVYYSGTISEWTAIQIGSSNAPLNNAKLHLDDGSFVLRGECGDNHAWSLDSNGTLTISGTGDMTNYDGFYTTTAPWGQYYESINSVVFKDGVTTIGNSALCGCSSLTSVTIPDSITSIGDSAFKGCDKIKDVAFAGTKEAWNAIGYTFSGVRMHYNCASLEDHYVLMEILEPTCESAGYKKYNCVCGYEYKEIIPINHNYEFSKAVASTCISYGYDLFVCSKCGAEKREYYNELSDHNYQITAVEPSCLTGGYTLHKCSGCGDSYKDELVPALGHSEVSAGAKAPTCTEAGHTAGTCCSRCGKIMSGMAEIAALGHGFGEWTQTKAPTCTECGTESRTCTRCNATETRAVAATGHHYTAKVIAPTCTVKGHTIYTCACGETYISDYVDSLGHDRVHHEGKAATCTEKGWEAYDTCSRCDYSTYEEIAATGHHYKAKVNAPTCTRKGYTTYTCVCGDRYVDSYVDATGHSFGAWTQTKAPTCTASGTEIRSCTRCNATETRVVAILGHYTVYHEGKAATCTEKGWEAYDTCTRCDYSTYKEIAATGHHYTDTVTAPTCTEKGYTTHTCACGNSYVDSYTNVLGHSYGAWTQIKAPTCTATGTESRSCTRCNATETREIAATGHHYTDTVTAPSCTAKGYTTHTCACGNSYVDNYTNALGHSYKNGSCTRCNAKDPNYVAAPVIKITTSSGKPKISWSAVDGATKYYIYRSTDGKTYKKYTSTTKTSYTDSKATIGTTYYYKVKATKVVNGKEVLSAYSAAKSVKCIPAAPVVSISRSSGKAKLSWKAVSGASEYYIYRSTDGKTYKQYTTTTKTTYTDSKSASGKKYYYKVKAVAVVNKTNVFSTYSTAKNLMTTIATPSVSITTANGKPNVSWKAVTGADKYIVYRSTDGKTFEQLSTTTKTSLTNTSAKKNTKYYYKVKAVCTKNTSANSALSKAVSIKATK